MATNIPNMTIGDTGPVIPAESSIYSGAMLDLQNAFGGLLTQAVETPQGQLATAQSAAISQVYALFAQILAQFDPSTASGVYQDAIGRLYGLSRIAGQPTVVNCTCVGAAGTVIPLGALAQDTAGNTYVCTQTGTIPSGGSVILQFQNVVNGPIAAAAGSVTKIYKAITGWDSITNVTAGTLGNDVESRYDFELRRVAELSKNASGIDAAVQAAVLEVAGVTDCYVVSNNTNAAVSYGSTSYSIAARSMYVGVVGGTGADIGLAILKKKPPGQPTVGGTTVSVSDSNYTGTPPSYSIKYNVPSSLTIKMLVRVVNSTQLPSNASSLIKDAIVAAFNGDDGGSRARVGNTIYASRYAAPVVLAVPTAQLLSINVGTSTPAGSDNVAVGIDQVPVITASDITVTLV